MDVHARTRIASIMVNTTVNSLPASLSVRQFAAALSATLKASYAFIGDVHSSATDNTSASESDSLKQEVLARMSAIAPSIIAARTGTNISSTQRAYRNIASHNFGIDFTDVRLHQAKHIQRGRGPRSCSDVPMPPPSGHEGIYTHGSNATKLNLFEYLFAENINSSQVQENHTHRFDGFVNLAKGMPYGNDNAGDERLAGSTLELTVNTESNADLEDACPTSDEYLNAMQEHSQAICKSVKFVGCSEDEIPEMDEQSDNADFLDFASAETENEKLTLLLSFCEGRTRDMVSQIMPLRKSMAKLSGSIAEDIDKFIKFHSSIMDKYRGLRDEVQRLIATSPGAERNRALDAFYESYTSLAPVLDTEFVKLNAQAVELNKRVQGLAAK